MRQPCAKIASRKINAVSTREISPSSFLLKLFFQAKKIKVGKKKLSEIKSSNAVKPSVGAISQ